MQVSEAITSRMSCRDFSPEAVERATLERLMALTCRAPSAINLQPWQFTVVTGEEVGRLGKKLLRAHAERGQGCKPDNVSPLPTVYQERQNQLSAGMKPLLIEAGAEFASFINHGSLTFYGAPAVVVATVHRVFSAARALDVGLALGWLLLAAQELGLATCPIGLVCAYADVISDFLNLDDDRQVVLAVAVGRPKPGSPLNRFRTPRAPLGEVVRWY
ncbi:MAG: nitroreductase [Thermodesulfobacteriota bacterium]